jgi:Ca-activated chloride channel homolog
MRKTSSQLICSGFFVLLLPVLLSQRSPDTSSAQQEPNAPAEVVAATSPKPENTPIENPNPPAAASPPQQSDLVFVPPPPPRRPLTLKERHQRRQEAKRLRAERRHGKRLAKAASNALGASANEEFKIKANVELVLLDVSVKNSSGGFVSGLQKENFKVFDNKVAQDITIFQSQDVPVTVGLVVDNSGSVRPKKAEIITAALTLVRESNPRDEMFVVNFNDRVRMGLPEGTEFTDNHQLLRDALLLNPAQGRTALYDGLRTALEHLDKGRLDKKTLVLIADGGDNMSDTSKDEILSLIEESLATIYTVGIYNPDDKDKNPGFLKEVAEISGGEYYRPPDISHLVGICESIAKDIRNRYTLGYSPKDVTFDGAIRKLRVLATNAEGKKLEVRTRSQYVAESREAPSRDQ